MAWISAEMGCEYAQEGEVEGDFAFGVVFATVEGFQEQVAGDGGYGSRVQGRVMPRAHACLRVLLQR